MAGVEITLDQAAPGVAIAWAAADTVVDAAAAVEAAAVAVDAVAVADVAVAAADVVRRNCKENKP